MMSAKNVLLHTAKYLGVFALFRSITLDRPRILCYHGGSLGDEFEFNSKLFCPPGLLEQRLVWLKRKGFVPTGLDDLENGALPHQAGIPVVITIDDGWYSSATQLLPMLAQYGHQPVLYLATKVFTQGTPVLDVSIRYILWKSDLETATLSGFGDALDGKYVLKNHADAARLCERTEQWLSPWLDDSLITERMLEQFASALGINAADLGLSSRRFSYMRQAELLAAAAAGCNIELHGHAHLYVPGQAAQNSEDILTCRQHILDVGLPFPRHYCYPSGHYDQAAAATLQSIGVLTATTCVPGLVDDKSGTAKYFLPRFLDGGSVSMIEFEAEMSGVLDFVRRLSGRAVNPEQQASAAADA